MEKFLKIFKDRKIEDSLFLEKISSLILKLILENKKFLTTYKNNILDIFNSDGFFECNITSLTLWSEIIDEFLSKVNNEIINGYFDKINFSSFLSSRSNENK